MMSCTRQKKKNDKPRRPKAPPARLRKLLEDKLLALGGSRVVWQGNDPQAALIAARGEEFPRRVRMRRGEPHRCHANAAELWAGATDKYQLITGFALGGDIWAGHSWVVDEKHLYETTLRFDRYFGAALPPFLALKFWFENVLALRCPDGRPPPGFLEESPGVLALMEQWHQLPREERFRLLTAQSSGRCA